ncbi:Golgi membrane protein 1 isoform X2 [Rhinatrema bivittatum]|uniref:Golgi membrane protein 1 isoform X2 n=1 Tax=Rhinatrema bivittatum TaxID=194408 RepID=UPI0011266D6C|nr:Golgi membrane protein 1 isoform X2 [Rhinatrema bivittatum]
MLGLSNGRRGMKSPPLLVAGLLACVCVLGINYWITSTRCADMQVFLESNLTSKEKIIQALQAEMKTLQKDYEKLRGEMENFQESQAKKLNYELTQCSIKMKEMREQCEEQLKKTTGKSVDGPQPKETIVVEKIEILPVNEPKQEDPSAQKLEQSQTKTDVKEKGETSNKTEPKPPSDEVKIHINITDNQEATNQTRTKTIKTESEAQKPEKTSEKEPKKDANEEEPDAEGDEDETADEPMNAASRLEMENEVERESLISFDEPQNDQEMAKAGVPGKQEANVKNPNDKVADYNGDGGNEAEPEAEKQAALVDHPDQKDSLNDKKTENEQMIEENKKKARDQML